MKNVSRESASSASSGAVIAMDEQAPFTPGPWKACGEAECSCKVVSCGQHPIAQITSGKWGDDYASVRLVGNSSLDMKAEAYMEQITYGEVDEATAAANARLIAAAPDMYAALAQGIIDLDDILTETMARRPGSYRASHTLSNMRAALAKARLAGDRTEGSKDNAPS